jgi:hypothetical protein
MAPTPETEKRLQAAFEIVVMQTPPSCFRNNEKHVVASMEKGYAKLGVTLAECGCKNYEDLTVFQFYTWLESLDEKYQAQIDALNASKNGNKRK